MKMKFRKLTALFLAVDILCSTTLSNIAFALNEVTLKDTITKIMNANSIVEEIAKNNNAEDYYGKIVNGYETNPEYELADNYDWEIFYVGKNPNLDENDENNKNHIYLTTTDYIKVKDWVAQRNNFDIEKYNTDFAEIYKNDDNNGDFATTESNVKAWLSASDVMKGNGNKRVEYLLNSNEWNFMFKGDMAEYAIGAPTIDMYVASYKVTHPECNISLTKGEKGSILEGITTVYNNADNNLYTINNSEKADGQVIAGRPDGVLDGVYKINENGEIESGYIKNYSKETQTNSTSTSISFHYEESTTYGVRPVVCLNEDTMIELTTSEDNKVSYDIVTDTSKKITQNITIQARLKDTEIGLKGVQIVLGDENGNTIMYEDGPAVILTTNSRGQVNFGEVGEFAPGRYSYAVTSCPDGYAVDEDKTYEFTVNEDGTISYNEENQGIINIKVTNERSADDIAKDMVENGTISNYYGKVVKGYATNKDYEDAEKYNWQIFYVGKNPNLDENDENNKNRIYLTTTDYVNVKDWADSKGERSASKIRQDYEAIFSHIFGPTACDYTGKLETTSADVRNWLKYQDAMTETTGNKKVEYLLDTNVWNKKFKGKFGEYAIGAPTLDMYVASYNATHPYNKISYTAKDGGYVIDNKNVATDNALYVINKNEKSDGQVIAGAESAGNGMLKITNEGEFKLGYSSVSGSQTTTETTGSISVNIGGTTGGTTGAVTGGTTGAVTGGTTGAVTGGTTSTTTQSSVKYNESTTYGIRPIVCLKEDVTLKTVIENGEISYKIVMDETEPEDITVKVQKMIKDSTNTVQAVEGAQIALYDEQGIEIKDSNNENVVLTTDSEGKVDFGKVVNLGIGEYIYKVLSVPAEYGKTPTESYKFIVNEDRTITFRKNKGIVELEDYIKEFTSISGHKYMTKITTENNTVESILTQNNLSSTSVKITNNKGEVLSGTAKLGTGTKVEVLDKDNNVVDTYTVAIKGDNNGDGKINLYDILKLIELVFDEGKEYQWSDIEKLAGEYTGDGKVNLYDILRLIEYHFDGVKW